MRIDSSAWYAIQTTHGLDTPALVIYPARVARNIALLIASIDDLSRLRPHVKTHKSREATRLMLLAGIRKFKCATIAEADMLAQCGATDVLLAYQPNEAKIGRLLDLITYYPDTTFSCLVDNPATARLLSDRAVTAERVVSVYVDLNVGMNRTGIAPDASALDLYTLLATLAGVTPVGLHAYDGHIRTPDLATRTAQCDEVFRPVLALRDALLALDYPEPVIVAGGSPTFPIHARRSDVECSPGTFIYWDKGYQALFAEQAFLPAALVVTRVISQPDATKLCLDLGHKSVAAECDLAQRVSFLNAPELQAIGQSEEHLVVEAGAGHPYQVGDVFYGLPNHICPTCALYERAYTVENGSLSGEWLTVARDRRINY
ncbi:MAG: D-TA family PLP-dependent enzyme [Bacteroidetes bacterium]|nr:D-TA family PLP-dependent enzyme [Fibrella sp.]